MLTPGNTAREIRRAFHAFSRSLAAFDLGFRDAAAAAADDDLASLRGDPRWPFAKQP